MPTGFCRFSRKATARLRVLEATAQTIGQKPPYGFRASSPDDYRSYTDFYRNTLIKDLK